MKAKKKGKFLTFCFSFMPGAGEMYMGFFKTGVCVMLTFLLSVCGLSYLQFDGLGVALGVVIWCYSFFRVNHLSSLTEEEFAQVKDEGFFGGNVFADYCAKARTHRNVIAGLLIVVGVLMLWYTATDVAREFLPQIWKPMAVIGDYFPRVAVAVLIMIAGVKLICGKKALLAQPEETADEKMQEEA